MLRDAMKSTPEGQVNVVEPAPAVGPAVEAPPSQEELPFLPFAVPSIGVAEIADVTDALLSGWLTTGPRTKEFERAFADYVGAPHAVAVNSATAGLHLSLAALGIGPGDEVITTPLTFCATANVVVHLGAKPVFADVGPDLNIDPGQVRARITPRTKAIMPVHFAGLPCAMDELTVIAREHGLPIVEDAAHAVGTSYRGHRVGGAPHLDGPLAGDTTVFSFYATKNMTTGEGGMVTCANPDLAGWIRTLSLHGISKDAWKRYSSEGSWHYEVVAPGYKYNMTDLQAALGLRQLARLEGFLADRRRIVARYDARFAELPEIARPSHPEDPLSRHAWHLYAIQLDLDRLTIDRAGFIEELRRRNIGASVHFIPVHLHPYYRDRFGLGRGAYPQAEYFYDRIVSLPLYPDLTDDDVERVADAVREIVLLARSGKGR